MELLNKQIAILAEDNKDDLINAGIQWIDLEVVQMSESPTSP